MKYFIEIKESAKNDAVEVFLYYENQQTGLGDKFLDKLELILIDISKHPKLYPEKHKQFRQSLIKPFPYLIVFEIDKLSIVVHKIIFAKKHPDKFYS